MPLIKIPMRRMVPANDNTPPLARPEGHEEGETAPPRIEAAGAGPTTTTPSSQEGRAIMILGDHRDVTSDDGSPPMEPIHAGTLWWKPGDNRQEAFRSMRFLVVFRMDRVADSSFCGLAVGFDCMETTTANGSRRDGFLTALRNMCRDLTGAR